MVVHRGKKTHAHSITFLEWSHRGPYNTNGRTRQMVINTVLVKINAKGHGLQMAEGQKWTGSTRQVNIRGGLPLIRFDCTIIRWLL
jgi:hypothetical protein